jgi:hypothetical protein
MKQTVIISLVALLGTLVLPSAGSAKTCEELLAGNTYSCTLVRNAVDKGRASSSVQNLQTTNFCAAFLLKNASLVVDVGGPFGTQPCTCLAKGKLANPKFDESNAFVCVVGGAQNNVAPARASNATSLAGKAGKKGIKQGLYFNGIFSAAFECTLDPECVTPAE